MKQKTVKWAQGGVGERPVVLLETVLGLSLW